MADAPGIFVGKGKSRLHLLLALANRHGLIAGATGTGKTATLRVLAEGFAAAGVPVFVADVKGDLAGLSKPGEPNPKIADRAKKLGIAEFSYRGVPTIFWDLYARNGHPIRATISDMGPLLLARLLELNETQSGILQIAFKYADDNGLLLLDLKDLRALLAHMAENAADLKTSYGNVSAASVGAVQRGLLAIEAQGGDAFFGEPELDLADLMRKDGLGNGIVSILSAETLMMRPKLYATFLLWLLAELFERLPEVGDLDRPKLVFFFDEAHLLFDDAPAALVDKVEQVVRLIRSKGVGIYFVTQNPLDIPERVLGQLGNRVQHALRAFTPRDQKAVRAAAETFRADPKLDTAKAIMELGVGEALVSLLDEAGTPTVVQRALIAPPASRLGPLSTDERSALVRGSPLAGKYEQPLDRESAYEKLTQRTTQPVEAQAQDPAPTPRSPWGAPRPEARPEPRARREPQTMTEMVVKSVARNVAGTIGRQIGNQIVRGILGSILRR
ncbi:MAG TPA: helicase HerA-like domain-containing protein [Alphaproteobacteria bacterium]|nr:helicase HerA-like domain-containing protein [Alphaproteobacteria bacterium]